MEQTAVEWFLNEFKKQVWFEENSELDIWINDLIPKAKAMEKQQIENALQWSHDFGREIGYKHLLYNYYKETYESNT